MASWFTSGLDKLKEVTEKVKDAVPIDKEMIAKLTLNTDEMKAEREMFGEEQNRKARAKDALAGMLPWETRDPERDILVEECKEAILALSKEPATFFGPYEVPPLAIKDITSENSKDESIDYTTSDDDVDGEGQEEDGDATKPLPKDMKPSPESLAKLAKLEPLPPLLAIFDLDSHVGLIQKVLKEDPKLVEMQSNLSGGGEREKAFWHNYFFHCAYTRYEAGLSIDEIWSDEPILSPQLSAEGHEEDDVAAAPSASDAGEETVMFDHGAAADEDVPADGSFSSGDVVDSSDAVAVNESSPPPSLANDFELVDDDDDNAGDGGELDELEAEIARELED